jgi:hypothetical protein
LVAALAVCGLVQAGAQVPKSHSKAAPPGAPAPAASPASAPVYFDATAMGSPVTLDKNWRVGITSNPDAAKSDFDDSHWAVRNAEEAMPEVPDEDQGSPTSDQKPDRSFRRRGHSDAFVWFRLHVKLAPNHGPVYLLIELPVSISTPTGFGNQAISSDVFANGTEINAEGPHGDSPQHYQPISRLYNLNIPASETSVTLALRSIYIPFGYAAYTSFFAERTLRLGHPQDLGQSLELWSVHGLFERLPRLIISILLVFLAAFLLALYFVQKGHPEYLWLALHELVQAPIAFIDLAGSSGRLDQLWNGALLLQLVAISAYFYFEFLVAFLDLGQRWAGKRKRWIIRLLRFTAPVLALLGTTLLAVEVSKVMALVFAFVLILSMFWMIGWVLFCVITLIAATARRNFEAGLLLFPLVLTFVGILEPIVTSSMKNWTGHPYVSPLTIPAGPIPIHFASIADFIGLLAIVLIIFFRFLRIHRDRERASSELAAARSVQELMIPAERLKTPGFEVDSIYNPANEVGGDFFHVEASDGGLLVVIGDVAGKGLKAAMNVSMLMGALRRIEEKRPAKILESLNRVLVGGDSFTTCQAAWFSANGELVIANAGHLPPYLNTQEIQLPGGLPLGVVTDVKYEEVRLYLHPGDRLLLLSDGVVEARHSTGELFGFDRVHNLSNQSAFYIADAAKAFGQEDDITVLTVRRLATAVAA